MKLMYELQLDGTHIIASFQTADAFIAVEHPQQRLVAPGRGRIRPKSKSGPSHRLKTRAGRG